MANSRIVKGCLGHILSGAGESPHCQLVSPSPGKALPKRNTYPGPGRMIKENGEVKAIRGKGASVCKVMEVHLLPVRCSGGIGAEL